MAVHRVFSDSESGQDSRFAPPRTLNDKYHPWTPPKTLPEWEEVRSQIRKQLLLATGLWPLPEKTPLDPVIHGRVERDDYTVERVFFASRPGVYVTGSLYRPKGDRDQKRPAVLCPHGHWPEGRFYQASDAEARKQIENGAESDLAAAKFPVQARMVQLARMGCVVFFFDMIGNADSQPLHHTDGFSDVQAELWSQNLMGLQTWNTIRAYDFLESLPDVDPQRIGVTGASGGGTQTFMLCAIDPRPAVAFPAVMVSTGMQGGCVCENASWLRIGLNNVAIAACFAPKPLAMTGANDWTIDIETKGLPELKQVYELYGKGELVHAKCFPQFGHNYNQPARQMMYEWLNTHLHLGLESPIVERPFQPLTKEEATVFTAEHPLPKDALPAAALRERMTEEAITQSTRWITDRDHRKPIEVLQPIFQTCFGMVSQQAKFQETTRVETDDATIVKGRIERPDGSHVPCLHLLPKGRHTKTVVWVDGSGKQALFEETGRPIAAVRQLLNDGYCVVTGDVLLTGESQPADAASIPAINERFAGYTWGYNRPLISERIRDIASLVMTAPFRVPLGANESTRPHFLIGTAGAGPWCLPLRTVVQERVIADLDGFTFGGIRDINDPNLLPGAMKFGGLSGFPSLTTVRTLELYGCTDEVLAELRPLLERDPGVQTHREKLTPGQVALPSPQKRSQSE